MSDASEAEARKTRKYVKNLAELAVVLLITILLAITNPSFGKHKNKLGEDAGPLAPVAGSLAGAFVRYRDFVVCSVTTYRTGSREGELATIGVLGMVFKLD